MTNMATQVARDLSAAYPEAVKPSKLAHVVIRTPRFEASKAWWSTVLDAQPSYENAQLSFMTYDDEHHRIGIINMPDLRDQDMANAGPEHIAFTYAELGALLATYRRLEAHGIAPFWTINHGPTISMYYRDPDGTKVELQYDVFDVEGVERFFASGAYEENFMGIVFDPEAMIAAYEAGTPLDQITRRPKLPEGMTPWDMHRD
ncbi:VOC family protein [Rhizorhabdus wittichii]|uniref:VOC family protein n=2 Tax=Rhizorhabdus wittichii TaxID=160791 RepID=A0A975D2E8_9SPHN|nr:VOC family protein [Rhizorhabdus wittichii]